MSSEEDVLQLLQRQIDSLKESRQQQLQLNADKAAHEATLRNAAIKCAQGLVKLNVGGVKYTTSLSTLTAVPDSFFASLFSGDWQSVTTAEGDMFVDRDGEVLEYFLLDFIDSVTTQAFVHCSLGMLTAGCLCVAGVQAHLAVSTGSPRPAAFCMC